MRRTLMIVMATLAATGAASAAETAPSCPAPQSDQLVGFWESQDRSKGGIGHTVEFRADGTFVEAVTVLVDMYYRVSGDRILVDEKPIADTGETKVSLPYRIEGGTLVQEQSGSPGLRKERVGAADTSQAPIVGVWRYRHPTGAMAFERYTPEGRLNFRLPMTSSAGCYAIEGATLKLAPVQRKAAQTSFELRDGDLVFSFPGRGVSTYHRDPAGPWYERERIGL